MINFNKFNINTNGRTSGRMKAFCPQCHDRRKNKRDRSLSVNLDLGLAYCHYCNWSCNANTELHPKKGSSMPHGTSSSLGEGRGEAILSDTIVRWFAEERGIPASVLIDAGITSAEEFMPQTGHKELCICFNYYEGDRLVNIKFRDLKKNFKLIAGRELIPYNINSILGRRRCMFTEGEADTLAIKTVGFEEVVSVPGGANNNLSWLDRFVESHFEDKEEIYICVDTDRKGTELRDELLRRFGAERCRVVDLSPCKDANEMLLLPGGAELLKAAIENAPQTPLEGVYSSEDVADELRVLFENGLGSGAETGLENLDKLCTFELGRLCVVTGIPGCGKSEFVDELVLRLCLRHHWRVAFFSPENMPLTYHLQKLAEKLTGRRFRRGITPEPQYEAVTRFLDENVASILPKEDYTVETILSRARELVRRKGTRILVVDPFNRLEHRIPNGQNETQYISALLDGLTNFAQRNRCLVILVAHPIKMNREPGMLKKRVPDLYDINGSAAFYNKADFGMVVERDREAGITRIHVEKVKFKHLGDNGIASFRYNAVNGRLAPCREQPGLTLGTVEVSAVTYDNSSWLHGDAPEQLNFLTNGENHGNDHETTLPRP